MKGDGAKVILDLGEVKNFSATQRDTQTGATIGRFKDVGGAQMGLGPDDFGNFQDFLTQSLESEVVNGRCEYRFLIVKLTEQERIISTEYIILKQKNMEIQGQFECLERLINS
jgi:hypothetical protein